MYNLSFQPTASVSSGSAFVVCSIHRFCLVTGSEEEHSPVLKTLERSAARKMPSKSLEDISSDSSSENKVCPAVHASPKLPNARVLCGLTARWHAPKPPARVLPQPTRLCFPKCAQAACP